MNKRFASILNDILRHKWAAIALAAVALILIFLSLNLINIGMEQTFNPRLKGTTGT